MRLFARVLVGLSLALKSLVSLLQGSWGPVCGHDQHRDTSCLRRYRPLPGFDAQPLTTETLHTHQPSLVENNKKEFLKNKQVPPINIFL